MRARRSAIKIVLVCFAICFCWGSLQSMQVLSRLVPSIQSKSVSATTTRKLAAVVQPQNTMGRGSLRKIDHSKRCLVEPVCFASSRLSAHTGLRYCIYLVDVLGPYCRFFASYQRRMVAGVMVSFFVCIVLQPKKHELRRPSGYQ